MKSDKFDNYVLIGVAGTLIIVVAGLFVTNVHKTLSQELDFKKREINGIVLQVDSIGRGKYEITIKQFEKPDTLVYSLFMGQIVKDFRIGPNDSISKSSNTFSATFYKKQLTYQQ